MARRTATIAAMSRGLGILCLCVMALVSPARADIDNPNATQKQAFYAKPSVVRVVAVWEIIYTFDGREQKDYIGGTGSGFFVSSDGFVVTNAHVVQEIKEGEEAAKKKSIQRQLGGRYSAYEVEQMLQRISVKITPKAEIVLPDGTKLPYEIRAYGAPVGEGKDVAVIKVDIKNAPNLAIGDSDRIQIQDNVLAIGYPGAADLDDLFDEKSSLGPR